MTVRKISARGVNFFDHFAPFLMVVPAVFCIFMVHIYPSVRSIGMSFFDINLTKPARPFIGFRNYAEAFSNPTVLRILLNTFMWPVFTLIFGGSFALFVAQQLNKAFKRAGRYSVPSSWPPGLPLQLWYP